MLREIAIGTALSASMSAAVQAVEAFSSIGPPYGSSVAFGQLGVGQSLLYSFSAASGGTLQSIDYVMLNTSTATRTFAFDLALYASDGAQPGAMIAQWSNEVTIAGRLGPQVLTQLNGQTINLVQGTTYYFGFGGVVGPSLQLPSTTMTGLHGFQAYRGSGASAWTVTPTDPGNVEYFAFRINVPSPSSASVLAALAPWIRRRR